MITSIATVKAFAVTQHLFMKMSVRKLVTEENVSKLMKNLMLTLYLRVKL